MRHMPDGVENVVTREEFDQMIDREVRAREQIELEGLPNAFKRIGELADILKAETTRLDTRIRVVEEEFAILAQDESHPAGKLRTLESKIEDIERQVMKVMDTSRKTVTMLLSVNEEMDRQHQSLREKVYGLELRVDEIMRLGGEEIDLKMSRVEEAIKEVHLLKKAQRRTQAMVKVLEERLKAHLAHVRKRKRRGGTK